MLSWSFSAIQQKQAPPQQVIRAQILEQRQASAKNRRLALQMANRPPMANQTVKVSAITFIPWQRNIHWCWFALSFYRFSTFVRLNFTYWKLFFYIVLFQFGILQRSLSVQQRLGSSVKNRLGGGAGENFNRGRGRGGRARGGRGGQLQQGFTRGRGGRGRGASSRGEFKTLKLLKIHRHCHLHDLYTL